MSTEGMPYSGCDAGSPARLRRSQSRVIRQHSVCGARRSRPNARHGIHAERRKNDAASYYGSSGKIISALFPPGRGQVAEAATTTNSK